MELKTTKSTTAECRKAEDTSTGSIVTANIPSVCVDTEENYTLTCLLMGTKYECSFQIQQGNRTTYSVWGLTLSRRGSVRKERNL